MAASGGHSFRWVTHTEHIINYHRRPICWIKVPTSAKCCLQLLSLTSSTDCMHWSLKQSQIQHHYIRHSGCTRKCKSQTSDAHKHCTMQLQPFDTAFTDHSPQRQTCEWGSLRTAPDGPLTHIPVFNSIATAITWVLRYDECLRSRRVRMRHLPEDALL